MADRTRIIIASFVEPLPSPWRDCLANAVYRLRRDMDLSMDCILAEFGSSLAAC